MRKHLFFLTNNQLTAAIWNGSLAIGPTFNNDAAGWEAFTSYLAEHRNLVAQILIDLIEEDFQRENIPHVVGKNRTALIQRRLTQLYRDTPFHHASPQGREKEGRKDDRMLFSALINAELPKPWLAAIRKEKIPLAGIYSVPLLSVLLLKKLHLPAGAMLLVSHQSSGLRQSYFQDGQLRFSRLTQMSAQEPAALADTANAEIAKTRQFLVSTRQLQRDQHMNVVVLIGHDILPNLQELSPDTPTLTHRFIAPDEAQGMLGLKTVSESPLCDPVFLSLLARSGATSHYNLSEHQRFYMLWQGRTVLYFLSGVTLATGLVWTGINGMEIIDASSQSRRLEQATQASEQRYQVLMKSMPDTVANPHDMKVAVDLAEQIAQNAPSPEAMLVQVSHALDKLPQIKIDQMQWQSSETEPVAEPAAANQPPAPKLSDTPPAAALLGIPAKPIEILTITGEVTPFKNDYRTALENVKQLATELRKNKQLQVEISRPPLDIRPSVNLKGQTGKDNETASARFELKLVRKP